LRTNLIHVYTTFGQEPSHHTRGSMLTIQSCEHCRRDPISSSSVHVGTTFLDQTLNNVQMTKHGCASQGRGTVFCCLVDVGTELLREASYNIQTTELGCDHQGRTWSTKLRGLIDVDT
jgi:hypothetical protein